MARYESEHIHKPFQKAQPEVRRCDAQGCEEEGLYRAPVSRDRLRDYYWFCLDHVRDYNRAWNYFSGLSPEEVEMLVRDDTVWQRPTWRFAGKGEPRYEKGPDYNDPYGFFGQEEREARPQAPQTEEGKALATLGLSPEATFEEIRGRYRVLVKLHHPDANGGDKEAEERLKVINRAYATLKAVYS